MPTAVILAVRRVTGMRKGGHTDPLSNSHRRQIRDAESNPANQSDRLPSYAILVSSPAGRLKVPTAKQRKRCGLNAMEDEAVMQIAPALARERKPEAPAKEGLGVGDWFCNPTIFANPRDED